jgi:hypothetical protein
MLDLVISETVLCDAGDRAEGRHDRRLPVAGMRVASASH